MITFKACSEVNDHEVFKVFKGGYSDYFFKFTMTEEVFVSRFLENEADRSLSYLAYDGETPVGLILGNIRMYHDIKTMRCGGFAVLPEYRDKGVGLALFEEHKKLARENGCKQLYLEVLKQNEKAKKFYDRVGYHAVHDYRLYKGKADDLKPSENVADFEVSEVDMEVVKEIRATMPDMHIYWQGEMFTIEHFADLKHFGFYRDGDLCGLISAKPSGMINFMWVKPDLRQQGLGRDMINYVLQQFEVKELVTVSSNNLLYEGFLRRLGFESDVEQYEMMLVL